MSRITEAQLQFKIDCLNKITGNPLTPWSRENGKNTANVGNYHLDGAYGGWQLVQQADGGGCSQPLGGGFCSKREMAVKLESFISGVNLSKKEGALKANQKIN